MFQAAVQYWWLQECRKTNERDQSRVRGSAVESLNSSACMKARLGGFGQLFNVLL
jgi:hypothetical protein